MNNCEEGCGLEVDCVDGHECLDRIACMHAHKCIRTEMVEEVTEMGEAEAEAVRYQVGGDHYKQCKIQPIDFILANDLSFLQGNILKYLVRFDSKNGVEDLRKAAHYLEMLIEQELSHDSR